MKIVYSYDEITKEYVGTTVAQEDWRASKLSDTVIYMMPDNSTQVEPPVVTENQVAVFNGISWDIKPDYRNEVVFNLITREPFVIKEIGNIPTGYVKELPERLEDLKVQLLYDMKVNFANFLSNTKITVKDNAFYYSSLDRLVRERDINLAVSRDDSNKIYSFSKDDYNDVINYLTVFGQLLYTSKWNLESAILNCKDIQVLKEYNDKIEFTSNCVEDIDTIVTLTPAKRKNYFIKLANNIK